MNTQFKKGVIDLCVLALVKQNYQTTYQITKALKDSLGVNENTIYPMLRRLTDKSYLEYSKVVGEAGAPTKIYTLTANGQRFLNEEINQWMHFTHQVQSILGDIDE